MRIGLYLQLHSCDLFSLATHFVASSMMLCMNSRVAFNVSYAVVQPGSTTGLSTYLKYVLSLVWLYWSVLGRRPSCCTSQMGSSRSVLDLMAMSKSRLCSTVLVPPKRPLSYIWSLKWMLKLLLTEKPFTERSYEVAPWSLMSSAGSCLNSFNPTERRLWLGRIAGTNSELSTYYLENWREDWD